MAPRITFIGGGIYQWAPKLLVDLVNTPSLADAEIVLEDIDPAPLPRDDRARRAHRAVRGHRADGHRDDRPARRARRRRLRGRLHLDRRAREHAPRPRDPGALRHQAVGRRHRRARAASSRALRNIPVMRRHRARHGGGLPRRVDAQPHQPDDHADAVRCTRETVDRRRSGCATRSRWRPFVLSLLLDARLARHRARRSPASTTSRSSPAATSTATTGSRCCADLLDRCRRASATSRCVQLRPRGSGHEAVSQRRRVDEGATCSTSTG